MKDFLPDSAHPFIDVITVAMQIALVIFVALLLRSLLHRLIVRLGADKQLPLEFVIGGRRVITILLFGTALLLVLDRMGVSGMVIWTAFTGFAAVGAIAFFAAWSVLSNIFCAVLIFTSRPFGLRDRIELLEGGDKPGLAGEVMDINLIYTTLREETSADAEPSYLRVPNSLFFQRITRLRTRESVVRSLLD
jgi:small-conductance mechanosensitive channel